MPSLSRRYWTSAFRSHYHGHSPAHVGTEVPTPAQTDPPSYEDEIGESSSSAYGIDSHSEDSDKVSVTSAQPPSYRSQTTITAPLYDLLHPMTFELLPRPLFDEIASYLPISSRLCLRYTCPTFFHSLSEQTPTSSSAFSNSRVALKIFARIAHSSLPISKRTIIHRLSLGMDTLAAPSPVVRVEKGTTD